MPGQRHTQKKGEHNRKSKPQSVVAEGRNVPESACRKRRPWLEGERENVGGKRASKRNGDQTGEKGAKGREESHSAKGVKP